MARRVPDELCDQPQPTEVTLEFGNPDEFLCDLDLERFVTELKRRTKNETKDSLCLVVTAMTG